METEFTIPSVLRSLSLLESREEQSLTNMLECLDPSLHSVLKNAVGLLEQKVAHHPADSRKFDWKHLECKLIQEVTGSLKAVEDQISQEMDIDGIAHDNIILPIQIQTLEAEIERELILADRIQAASGPRTLLLCQITSWSNLMGFNLESFEEDKLVLTWKHHGDQGIETCVVFNPTSLKVISIDPRLPEEARNETNRIESFISSLRELKSDLMKELEGLEMDESLMKLSRCMESLDKKHFA
jgi:hypothetical protein